MADLQIRWARIEDARGIAVVHIDSWRSAYHGLIDQQVLDGLSLDDRAARWRRILRRSLASNDDTAPAPHRLLVAESGDRIVAWSSFGAGRDDGERHRGEVSGFYAHPDVWGQGVGHTLMMRSEAELVADGFPDAYLWGLDGNERAIRFYERHGWLADGGHKTGRGGTTEGLHELRHVTQLR